MKKGTNLARSAAVVFSMTLISSACYATCSDLGTGPNTSTPTLTDATCNRTQSNRWTGGDLTITSTGVAKSSTGNGLAATDYPVGTLTNNGLIETTRTSASAVAFYISQDITLIDNAGTITNINAYGGSGISNTNSASTITEIRNSGLIYGITYGIRNDGAITSIFNSASGQINSSNGGQAIWNSTGTIGTITNIGTMGGAGINNPSSIGVINNLQGGTSPLLFTSGSNLPTNYNIIINSTSQYGKLSVSSPNGTMAFNIYGNSGTTLVGAAAASTVVANRYTSVLQGFTSLTGITGTTGTYNGVNYSLVQNTTTATDWDLLVTAAGPSLPSTPSTPSGPSAADTQDALKQSATALRTVFNQQTAVVNNSLTYDCTVFAANGACVSAGGRFATPNSITGEQTSTLLVAAYKAAKNIRVGGFIDQNGSTSNANNVVLDKSPIYGVFGVWNDSPDLMGYEVRLSTSYSNQSLTQTRNVVGTSEAGVGTAALTSQAVSGVVSYAMAIPETSFVASPYVGIRKTKVKRDGYTETSAVTTPLTYGDLAQNITTALAGVRLNKQFGNDVFVTCSVGVEQNVGSNISTLDATGVTGLTATDFSTDYAKTRPVASVGASYAIDKTQRVTVGAMYRKEAFQSSGSTTGMVMYQVGL